MTTSTCPSGTTLGVAQRADGRVEWCTAHDPALQNLPVPGRTLDAATQLQDPGAMPGGFEGPFTAWYANGKLRAHGSYRDEGTRSVPDGLWVFWRPDGTRSLAGHYQRGTAVGCFAVWDEHGIEHVGVAVAGVVHEQACTPVGEDELAIIEGRVPTPVPRAPWADASVMLLAGPGDIGARTPGQDVNHGMPFTARATARVRLGHWRIGPSVGYAPGGDANDSVISAALGGAWGMQLHPRIEAEIGAEVGGERITVDAFRGGKEALEPLVFSSPVVAANATLAFALSPVLTAIAGVRVEDAPEHDEQRDTIYVPVTGGATRETWQVGGFAVNAMIGLRLLVR